MKKSTEPRTREADAADLSHFLRAILSGRSLNRAEAYACFDAMLSGPLPQQGGLMCALRYRGETYEELEGFLDYVQAQAMPLILDAPDEVFDIAGTGGDGINTINVSTAASLVVASAGVKVAKHGGRANGSLSGSMDVIECLGIPMYTDPATTIEAIRKNNYAFIAGRKFNPLLEKVAALRSELKVPTFLNMLFAIAHPGHVKRTIIGVYSHKLMDPVLHLLKKQGDVNAMVVHSQDGMDEISVSAPTHIALLQQGTVSQYIFDPEALGLKKYPLSAVQGGRPAENAKIIRDVFSNQCKGAYRDIIAINGAAGLLVAGNVPDMKSGLALANYQIDSGQVLALLNTISSHVV